MEYRKETDLVKVVIDTKFAKQELIYISVTDKTLIDRVPLSMPQSIIVPADMKIVKTIIDALKIIKPRDLE